MKRGLVSAVMLSLLAGPQAALGSIAAEPAWSGPPVGGGKSDLQGLRRRTEKRTAGNRAKRRAAKASRRRNRS